MWNILKTADHGTKWMKIWDSGFQGLHMQDTFDARLLEFGLGSSGSIGFLINVQKIAICHTSCSCQVAHQGPWTSCSLLLLNLIVICLCLCTCKINILHLKYTLSYLFPQINVILKYIAYGLIIHVVQNKPCLWHNHHSSLSEGYQGCLTFCVSFCHTCMLKHGYSASVPLFISCIMNAV